MVEEERKERLTCVECGGGGPVIVNVITRDAATIISPGPLTVPQSLKVSA